jgi:hypothetical protein
MLMVRRAGRGLIAAAAIILVAAPAAGQQNLRFSGKHGLWVQLTGDSVAVHWLTDETGQGALEVFSGGHKHARLTTPEGQVHRAVFHAAGLDTVELRFGYAAAQAPPSWVRVSLRPPAKPRAIHEQPDSLFVLGDTHGAFDPLVAGLRTAGLIDAHHNWTGGRSHLVFAGDLTDRGPDVLRLLWFVYTLEQQARAAGGKVHVLLGNHEIMVMLADLRYVHEKELYVASLHGANYYDLFDPRTSLLGRWLASKPAVIRIGEVVIAHGGVAPEYARLPIDALNDTLAHYLSISPRLDDTTAIAVDSVAEQTRHDFFWSNRSIFWHRDYVRTDSAHADIDEALRLWSGSVMVLGHTAVPQIQDLYGGRIIATHTPRFGAELLLIVHRAGKLERYRISAPMPAQRF